MTFYLEAGYKMRIAEYVLEGELDKARQLAEDFAATRDRHATEAEFMAAITC